MAEERIEWGIRTPEGTTYPVPGEPDRSRPPFINQTECEWVRRRVWIGDFEAVAGSATPTEENR